MFGEKAWFLQGLRASTFPGTPRGMIFRMKYSISQPRRFADRRRQNTEGRRTVAKRLILQRSAFSEQHYESRFALAHCSSLGGRERQRAVGVMPINCPCEGPGPWFFEEFWCAFGILKTPQGQSDERERGISRFPPSACAPRRKRTRSEAILSADVLCRARSLRQRALHRRKMQLYVETTNDLGSGSPTIFGMRATTLAISAFRLLPVAYRLPT